MKVAIPHWQGRVSPVLDVAGNVLVADHPAGDAEPRREVALTRSDPFERAKELARAGIDVVICGALSRPLEMALRSAGVEVIAHTCGAVEEVLSAYAEGRLMDDAFLMPGCCGRRRRLRGRRRRGRHQPRLPEQA